MFILLRNIQTISHSHCAILYSHQRCMGHLLSQHHQHVFLPVFQGLQICLGLSWSLLPPDGICGFSFTMESKVSESCHCLPHVGQKQWYVPSASTAEICLLWGRRAGRIKRMWELDLHLFLSWERLACDFLATRLFLRPSLYPSGQGKNLGRVQFERPEDRNRCLTCLSQTGIVPTLLFLSFSARKWSLWGQRFCLLVTPAPGLVSSLQKTPDRLVFTTEWINGWYFLQQHTIPEERNDTVGNFWRERVISENFNSKPKNLHLHIW